MKESRSDAGSRVLCTRKKRCFSYVIGYLVAYYFFILEVGFPMGRTKVNCKKTRRSITASISLAWPFATAFLCPSSIRIGALGVLNRLSNLERFPSRGAINRQHTHFSFCSLFSVEAHASSFSMVYGLISILRCPFALQSVCQCRTGYSIINTIMILCNTVHMGPITHHF